jgi:hypothetical protein
MTEHNTRRTVFLTPAWIGVLVLSTLPAASQTLTKPSLGLSTVAEDRRNTIFSSERNGNPAWLYLDKISSDLWIHLNGSGTSGSFRGAFEPGSSSTYQYYVEGARRMGDLQVVRGEFGFHQDFRSDWMWLDSKNDASTNPFLLGDSSTGETVYRGIVSRAQYAMLLADRWIVGAELDYGVNNGVKSVTPKPTSTNRDLATSVGLGYSFDSGLNIGASFAYVDQQEEISFVDEGAGVLTETVLFKFRGLDRFLRLTKKNETRNTQLRGYQGKANATISLDANTDLAASGGGGVMGTEVTDGGTSPLAQGHWQNERGEGHLKLHHRMGWFTLGVQADFCRDSYWARHPEYDVLFLEGHASSLALGGGVEAPLIPDRLIVAAEYLNARETGDAHDYLSGIIVDQHRVSHTMQALAQYRWHERVSTSLVYSYRIQVPLLSDIQAPSASTFFRTIRRPDLELFAAKANVHQIVFGIDYDTQLFGNLLVLIDYAHASPSGDNPFGDTSRSTLRVFASVKVMTF